MGIDTSFSNDEYVETGASVVELGPGTETRRAGKIEFDYLGTRGRWIKERR